MSPGTFDHPTARLHEPSYTTTSQQLVESSPLRPHAFPHVACPSLTPLPSHGCQVLAAINSDSDAGVVPFGRVTTGPPVSNNPLGLQVDSLIQTPTALVTCTDSPPRVSITSFERLKWNMTTMASVPLTMAACAAENFQTNGNHHIYPTECHGSG